MTKLLDYVSYNDDKQLNRLAKTLGLVLDHDAVWQEAKDQFDDGATSAEVRIDGLDYIIITKDIKKIYKVISDRDKLNSIRDLVLETREYFTDGVDEEILNIIKGE